MSLHFTQTLQPKVEGYNILISHSTFLILTIHLKPIIIWKRRILWTPKPWSTHLHFDVCWLFWAPSAGRASKIPARRDNLNLTSFHPKNSFNPEVVPMDSITTCQIQKLFILFCGKRSTLHDLPVLEEANGREYRLKYTGGDRQILTFSKILRTL